MARKNAPELSWIESRQLYRKRIKNPDTGRWIDVYGKTKAECRQKAAKRLEEIAELQKSRENPYVYEYAAKWYRLNTSGVGPKRQADYANAINNHICPVIGNVLVRDVKWDDILSVMAAASELSKSSQQKIVVTMKRIFAAAVKNGIISANPCAELKAGGKGSAEKIPLTSGQQMRLLEAVKGTRAELFVMLCLYAGLRREEALGMQWDCVFLKAKTPYLVVKRAVSWAGKNKPVVTEELKSEAAKREIPIPPQLLAALREARQTSTSSFLLPNREGEAMSLASFRRLWDVVTVRSVRDVKKKVDGKNVTLHYALGDKVQNHKVTVSLDFHVTPHQLRHTYITELILAGANVKTVQYLAGHATPYLTLKIYTHLIEHSPTNTVGAVMAAFGGTDGGTNTAELQKSQESCASATT